ncbi:MAG TPA: hypothetical protein VFJ16_23265 [Longimicrobium sp.]|nr:hypothetical protein [Longimicrobium sp.]
MDAVSAPILQRAGPFTQRPHRRPEDAIPKPLDSIDRALNTHKPRSRLASVVIIVLGLAALAVALQYQPDRRRERAARQLSPGADTAAVLKALGAKPTRCPGGAPEHLRRELNTADDAEADSVMGQLQRGTRQRWLYPGQHGCTPRKGETEVGIDAAGRLLWIQPAAEKSGVRLSPRIVS